MEYDFQIPGYFQMEKCAMFSTKWFLCIENQTKLYKALKL